MNEELSTQLICFAIMIAGLLSPVLVIANL